MGVHHISAFSSDLQRTMDFYTIVLGLPFKKEEFYWEKPDIRHLLFGNAEMLLSFSTYEEEKQGRHGVGMVNTIAFSVPENAMDFWINRLEQYKVPYKHPQQRFEDEVVIYFEDRDGLGLELVFNAKDQRPGIKNDYVEPNFAIRGLYNVEIWERSFGKTEMLLEHQLNLSLFNQKGNRLRYAVKDLPGEYVDVLFTSSAPHGFSGSGTVDRLAFLTKDVDQLFGVREQVKKIDPNISFIVDRKDWQSVFFASKTGVQMEVVAP